MLRTIFFVALLIVVPALCMAGVLLHPCDCGSGSSCAHEMQCESDPCGDDVLRPAPVAHAAPTDAAPCALAPAGALPSPSATAPANVKWSSTSRLGRRLHDSDVPLRI